MRKYSVHPPARSTERWLLRRTKALAFRWRGEFDRWRITIESVPPGRLLCRGQLWRNPSAAPLGEAWVVALRIATMARPRALRSMPCWPWALRGIQRASCRHPETRFSALIRRGLPGIGAPRVANAGDSLNAHCCFEASEMYFGRRSGRAPRCLYSARVHVLRKLVASKPEAWPRKPKVGGACWRFLPLAGGLGGAPALHHGSAPAQGQRCRCDRLAAVTIPWPPVRAFNPRKEGAPPSQGLGAELGFLTGLPALFHGLRKSPGAPDRPWMERVGRRCRESA